MTSLNFSHPWENIIFLPYWSDIDDLFKLIYTTIISNMPKCLGKGSGWITDSVIDHNINTSKYNPSTIQEKDWLIFKILMTMNALNGV